MRDCDAVTHITVFDFVGGELDWDGLVVRRRRKADIGKEVAFYLIRAGTASEVQRGRCEGCQPRALNMLRLFIFLGRLWREGVPWCPVLRIQSSEAKRGKIRWPCEREIGESVFIVNISSCLF